VLKDYGLEVPDGMDVKVVENADDCVHITLPAAPAGSMDLSDDELSNAAGGREFNSFTNYCSLAC
jgi:mersacidin/lichenicidin family type 2 lantibiotic